MNRRYLVTYEAEVIDYGYEGEEYSYITELQAHLGSYGEYEEWMQMWDMVSEPGFKVLSEKSIPVALSNLYIGLAKVVYKLGLYRFSWSSHLFYFFMERSLVSLWCNKLCEDFDHAHFASWHKSDDDIYT